ncbi:MAG: cytochrome d ubiquinol oxidase subunit II [Nitrospira sp.]
MNRPVLLARIPGRVSVGCTALTVTAVYFVQPNLRLNFAGHPMEYLVPLPGRFALGSSLYFQQRQRDTAAFLTSSAFIFLMLSSVTFGMYPYILVSTTDLALSLTVFNAATDSYGLTAGLVWVGVGFMLMLAYQTYVYSLFPREKPGRTMRTDPRPAAENVNAVTKAAEAMNQSCLWTDTRERRVCCFNCTTR